MGIKEEQTVLVGRGSQATIVPFGAQLLQWAPEGEQPVLWMSQLAHLDGSQPIRGGIPLCLPWFSNGRSGDLTPSHGFARTSRWEEIGGHQNSAGSQAASYRLDHTPLSSTDPFPHQFRALFRVALSDDLVVTLTVTNNDDHPFTFEEAFHAYFAVGDIKDVTIDGLSSDDYQDRVRPSNGWRTQRGELTFIEETDRIYRSRSPLVLRDPRRHRDILIDKEGSSNTVVWNPWVEGSRAISDIGPHDWQEFVCVEAANVGTDAVTLEPNEQHTLILVVHVDPFHW